MICGKGEVALSGKRNAGEEILKTAMLDIPLESRPFARIAADLGVTEEEVLQHLREMLQEGVIRRFGAVLHHRQAGILANAMVVWRVAEEEIDRVGRLFAEIDAVSHCYSRKSYPHWPYTVYTMVHAKTREQCEEIVSKMAELAGISEYLVLYGEKEFKKTSVSA